MSTITRRAGAIGALAAAALAVSVTSAAAVDSVTQTVTAGTRTAAVADLVLAPVGYSHHAQTTAGTMTLTADDSTGSYDGWNVTIQASDFVNATEVGRDIAASSFSLTTAAAPVSTAGQAVDATNGPKVPTASPVGTLDSARKTVQADVGYGSGTYTQALGVALDIPAQSAAGVYTATLTTTISAAP